MYGRLPVRWSIFDRRSDRSGRIGRIGSAAAVGEVRVEVWIIAVVVGVILLPVGILAVVARGVFRAAAPRGEPAGFRLFPGNALVSGLAAGWEQDRAAIAGVLREDLQVLRVRLATLGS